MDVARLAPHLVAVWVQSPGQGQPWLAWDPEGYGDPAGGAMRVTRVGAVALCVCVRAQRGGRVVVGRVVVASSAHRAGRSPHNSRFLCRMGFAAREQLRDSLPPRLTSSTED